MISSIKDFMAILLVVINLPFIVNIEGDVYCETVEIRSYYQLHELNDCTVVFGNVHLIFLPFADYQKYHIENRTFPLREITGYLMFAGIPHIETLGQLFPNLTVVRGLRLFHNYAFIVYECSDLKELTLRNLLRINRGSTALSGFNPYLCLPKIDWDSILTSGKLNVRGNDAISKFCALRFDTCHSCSVPGLCWHNGACQRFDSSYYVGNNKRKGRCHPLCLGPCIDNTPKGCYTCEDLSEDNECVEYCSPTRFLNIDTRRCITAEKCFKMGRNIYRKECLERCPKGYTIEKDAIDRYCIPCLENCTKVCDVVSEIKTIGDLEALGAGCNVINGSLEINIIEDVSNLTAELERYLGDVEEIIGNLKISRSTPLTSLTFLNKLRIVHGMENKSVNSSATIRIFENQNLQTTVDLRVRKENKIEVKSGNVLIYNNYMLCNNELNNFISLIEPRSSVDLNALTTNGNMRTCQNSHIRTYSTVLSHNKAEIIWQNLAMKKVTERSDIYLLQYSEIDNFEGSEFDENMLYERDTCSSYGWSSIIIRRENYTFRELKDFPSNMTMVYVLENLKQFTTYAFTIQLYNYNTSDIRSYSDPSIIGTSKIDTFKTQMNFPSRLRDVEIPIKTMDSITITWSILPNELEIVNKVYLHVYQKPFNQQLFDAHNDFCRYPLTYVPKKEDSEESIEFDDEKIEFTHLDCCKQCCLKENKRFDSDFEMKIKAFIDKKGVVDEFEQALIDFAGYDPRKVKRRNDNSHPDLVNKFLIDKDQRSFTVSKLKVFTPYHLRIYTCIEEPLCSDYVIKNEITGYNEKFDKVNLVLSKSRDHYESFHVQFDEPKDKNSIIIKYHYEIRVNSTTVIKTGCITRKQHQDSNYTLNINDLPVGEYQIRVAAFSLAQQGSFSDWHNFEIIDLNQVTEIGSPFIWMIFGISIIVVFIGTAFFTYYNRHRIIMLLRRRRRRQTDTISLMREMEPTDFNEIQLNHNNKETNRLPNTNENSNDNDNPENDNGNTNDNANVNDNDDNNPENNV